MTRLSETCAAPFGRHLPPSFAQRFACKRATRNLAIDGREPHFANWLRQICLFRKKRRKRAHSPNALHKFRLDTKGLGLHSLTMPQLPRAQKISPGAATLPRCVRWTSRTTNANIPVRQKLPPAQAPRAPCPAASSQLPRLISPAPT